MATRSPTYYRDALDRLNAQIAAVETRAVTSGGAGYVADGGTASAPPEAAALYAERARLEPLARREERTAGRTAGPTYRCALRGDGA